MSHYRGMMYFLTSHRVIAMTKNEFGKTADLPSSETVFRLLALKALLIATRNRQTGICRDNTIYEELAGITEDQLRKIRIPTLLKRIKAELDQYPDMTHEELLQPYPQLRELGKVLPLSSTEQIMLLIMIWFHQDQTWLQISSVLGSQTTHKVCMFFCQLTNSTQQDVAVALSIDGALFRSGLLKRTCNPCRDIENLYEPMDGLDEYVLQSKSSWDLMVKSMFMLPDRNKLTLDDFDYLAKTISPVLLTIKGAIEHHRRGTHILLYGPPGTGKTGLVHALGHHFNANLLSITTKDLDGSEKDGMNRFRSYLLGQRLFKGDSNTLFIFDELEDVFPSHFGAYFRDSSSFYKGYMNEALEDTHRPTIWTANSLNFIDKAHLRRFSCIIEVPVPPQSVRKKLLNKTLEDKNVSDAWITKVSESGTLTPAEIASLGDTVQSTGATGHQATALMETILKEKTRAIHNKPVQFSSKQDQIPYDLTYLNLDTPPELFLQGLQRNQNGSLLFYGAPGTGKSALARHLSRQLDKPIVMKRGSDLISMWIGGTEQNIAKAFLEAEREHAILFLDEADSFLRSRELAQRSWEVTEVNEMLVQMENFEGIFIAATNLIDNFDLAAFRRFDMKIRFDCLSPEQRWEVFVKLLRDEPDNPEELRDQYISQLAQLDDLSIGDYRAAIRNLNIRNIPVTAESLIDILKNECKFKHLDRMNKHPVGFVTH